MNRTIQLVTAGLAAWVLCGCGAPRPVKYYGMQVPPAPAPAGHALPVDLHVERMSGPSLLQYTPIVYRTGSGAANVYAYHHWEDAPVTLVPARLTRILRASGGYRSVTEAGAPSDAAFGIRGKLHKFEEVDGASISTQVSFDFELYDRQSGKQLWMTSYSQSEPVGGKEISDVVQSFERNLERGLKEVAAGLDKYFAANPPKPAN
jgi:ABC-type uncharacterized transport system auxiliary subunit